VGVDVGGIRNLVIEAAGVAIAVAVVAVFAQVGLGVARGVAAIVKLVGYRDWLHVVDAASIEVVGEAADHAQTMRGAKAASQCQPELAFGAAVENRRVAALTKHFPRRALASSLGSQIDGAADGVAV
jgi:hypothetical protein